MSHLPTPEQAIEAATRAVAASAVGGASTSVRGAKVGEPVVVHAVTGQASYLLVPLGLPGGGHGFVRIGPGATVEAIGRYGGTAPVAMTGPDVRARTMAHLAEGEEADEPVLVHDGPPGREAWLVATCGPEGRDRWLFVTPAGVYERPAGEILDPPTNA